MRTLFEIIESVKSNQETTGEEMFYAIVAIDALSTFDSRSLMDLANHPSKLRTPEFVWKESFDRWKRALNKSPKEWVGWENDPKNHEYQKRRLGSLRICDKILEQVKKESK